MWLLMEWVDGTHKILWFQASATMLMRSALFCDTMQRPWVTVYRRIGPIFTGQESLLTREDGTDTLSWNVGEELPNDAT
jgi:hypothetical protein